MIRLLRANGLSSSFATQSPAKADMPDSPSDVAEGPEGDIPRKIVGQNPAGWAERRLNIKAALGQ
jgi:hypothetical protein